MRQPAPTRVPCGKVADAHVLADDGWHARVGVHHHVVLQVRARAEFDAIHVAAQHGTEPDARARANAHIADEGGVRGDPGGRVDLRGLAFEGNDESHGAMLTPRRDDRASVAVSSCVMNRQHGEGMHKLFACLP